MLDGLRDYLDNGMAWPGDVVEATRQYREDSDPLGRFLAECFEPSKGSRVQSTRLHDVYAAWCRAAGEAPWTVKGLSGAMKDRGYTLIRSNQSWWTDIRLILSERDLGGADRSNEPEEPDDRS